MEERIRIDIYSVIFHILFNVDYLKKSDIHFWVGHTHFDPDATTKLITQGISGINVITIEDLHESIKKSVKNLLHIEHVLGFHNFSKLTKIEGFCNGLVGNILFLLKKVIVKFMFWNL